MEHFVIKCLSKREKCFERTSCPSWLLTILPARVKTLEPINDNEREDKNEGLTDLTPFKLVKSIDSLDENKSNKLLNNNEGKLTLEYPNDTSFENDLFDNYSQLISSPSYQQFIYLFNKLKEFEKHKPNINSTNKIILRCKNPDCFNRRVPLTEYCKIHILESDSKQILFVKCNDCQQISIKQDNNAIIHVCSSIK